MEKYVEKEALQKGKNISIKKWNNSVQTINSWKKWQLNNIQILLPLTGVSQLYLSTFSLFFCIISLFPYKQIFFSKILH